ncbi:MAG TPA: hypothetical protein VIF12_02425, partial [Micavibrio sp.]
RDPQNPLKPKFTCADIFNYTCQYALDFFTYKPHRNLKMGAAVASSRIISSLDPLTLDFFILREMDDILAKMEPEITSANRPTFDKIKKLGCGQWFTPADQKKAATLCERLGMSNPVLAKMAGDLYGLVTTRRTNGHLTIAFRKSVISAAEQMHAWSKDFLFDPEVPRNTYKALFGDARMDDSLRSIYISANNLTNKGILSFFCLKEDMFNLDPQAPSITSKNNHKLSDAVMAATSHILVYPPHLTEDGILCDDRATLHMPFQNYLNEVKKRKPADVTLKLVTIGTGWYVSNEAGKDKIFEDYSRSRIGDIATLIEEYKAYLLSSNRKVLLEMLGEENVIELSPRLSPRNHAELVSFPERNIVDASDENVRKIIQRGNAFVAEEDAKIRQLALMMAENAFLTGVIDQKKLDRVRERVGAQPETTQTRPTLRPAMKITAPDPKEKSLWDSAAAFYARVFSKAAQEQDNNKDIGSAPPKKQANGDSKPPAL